MESISRELALKPLTYYTSYTQIRPSLKALSPGESTHNRIALSNRRPINRRHTNRRKSPRPDYLTPDYPTPPTPTSILLEVRRGSPSNYPRRAGVPYIHRRCFLLTPDSAEYWVACANRPHNPLQQQITRLSFSGYTN